MTTVSPINQLLIEEFQELQSMRQVFIELSKPFQAQVCVDEMLEVTKELIENGVNIFEAAPVRSPYVFTAADLVQNLASQAQGAIIWAGEKVPSPAPIPFAGLAASPLVPELDVLPEGSVAKPRTARRAKTKQES